MQNLAVAIRPQTELGRAVRFPADEALVHTRRPAKHGPAAGLPDAHDPRDDIRPLVDPAAQAEPRHGDHQGVEWNEGQA